MCTVTSIVVTSPVVALKIMGFVSIVNHFAVQHSVGFFRVLNDSILCALKELPDYGRGKALLDAVTRGVVLEGRHRNCLPFGRQVRGTPGNVIAAARR